MTILKSLATFSKYRNDDVAPLNEPRLLRQVDVELLEIVPKLQILPDKVKIAFYKDNKQNRLSLSNFPRAAIVKSRASFV